MRLRDHAFACIRRMGLHFLLALIAIAFSADLSFAQPLFFQLEFGELGEEPGQFEQPAQMTPTPWGSICITDLEGDRVQEFDLDGNLIRVWGESGSGPGQFDGAGGITVGTDGALFVADVANHRIQEFDATGQYRGEWGRQGDGDGEFFYPYDIVSNGDGELFVSDAGNDRIQVFDEHGQYLRQFGESGSLPGQFQGPYGIDLDSDGNLLVAEFHAHRVQRLSPYGDPLLVFGSQGWYPGEFDYPRDVAAAPNGGIFVVDESNHRVQCFDRNGDLLYFWGDAGMEYGHLHYPGGVCLTDDYVFVLDTHAQSAQRWGRARHEDTRMKPIARWFVGIDEYYGGAVTAAVSPDLDVLLGFVRAPFVRRFQNDGTLLASWGTEGTDPGEFQSASSVAVGSDGTIYVADYQLHRVQSFTPEGKLIAHWGQGGYTDGSFRELRGLAAWSDGTEHRVYTVDKVRNRVQVFASDGTFLFAWGERGTGDGQFTGAHSIAINNEGELFVCDEDRVQVFASDGAYLRSWTVRVLPEDFHNSLGGVTVDPAGRVYVTIPTADRVRVFDGFGELLFEFGRPGYADGWFDLPIDVEASPDGRIYVVELFHATVQQYDPPRDAPSRDGPTGRTLTLNTPNRDTPGREMSSRDEERSAPGSRPRSDFDSREFSVQTRRSVPVRVVPNPFVGQATITFDLPEAGYVALSIHDVTGRKVHEAPPTWMDAGAQQLAWSPDELGPNAGSISSGTYFYQLRVTGPGTVSGTGPAPIALETGRIQHVR